MKEKEQESNSETIFLAMSCTDPHLEVRILEDAEELRRLLPPRRDDFDLVGDVVDDVLHVAQHGRGRGLLRVL